MMSLTERALRNTLHQKLIVLTENFSTAILSLWRLIFLIMHRLDCVCLFHAAENIAPQTWMFTLAQMDTSSS